MTYPTLPPVAWPFALPAATTDEDLAQLKADVDQFAADAQYGWAHTIDFGPFRMPGLFGEHHLRIAGGLDELGVVARPS
ncbi:MAG: hypothetical protein ABSH47_27290 [Bryobacteraceae bacterium]|jgi:hypothetical protein